MKVNEYISLLVSQRIGNIPKRGSSGSTGSEIGSDVIGNMLMRNDIILKHVKA